MLAKALQGATAAADKLYIEDVMSTYLYTGTGAAQTITNGIDLSGKGGLVWIKQRDGGFNYGHVLVDSARGVNRYLSSNLTNAQVTEPTPPLSSFNLNGFSLAAPTSTGAANNNTINYASWTFRKQPKFFDVVTWTGDGTSSRNIAHTLGSTPGFIIVKRTSATADWWCWHRSISTGNLSGNDLIVLNSTAAKTNIGTVIGTASSATFEVGGDSSVNASGSTYVAYLFAHDAGGFGTAGTDSVIKCGTFSGTGFVNLGWEPQWIMIKPYDQVYNWEIYDNMRGMGQPAGASAGQVLRPNTSGAEARASAVSFEATGFTQTTFGASYPCIYIAIRRGPMKTPTVGTSVFALNEGTGSTSGQSVTTNFPVDMDMTAYRTLGGVASVEDRIRGYGTTNTSGATRRLYTSETSAEYTTGNPYFYNATNTNITRGSNGADPGGGIISWFFRRAPGFFDVVAYTGTGAVTGFNHNLGIKPDLMIVKSRGTTNSWYVYSSDLAATKRLTMPSDAGASTSAIPWNNTEPTSTTFTLGANIQANISGDTGIAYLFATCPGVSKVGSYTGTGTTLNVDCGFTNGSRLVLIKRTDSTGDWYVWDTARGIISGNDPYLWLNSTAAEVTNTDYIDPLSSGFQISSTAPAAINANGGSYIYLSVA